MKFPYCHLLTSHPLRLWKSLPLITVKVFNEDKSKLLCCALVDSGAEKSLFHIEVAGELGLNLRNMEEEVFSGVEGGRLTAKMAQVPIQIVGEDCAISIPMGFVDNLGFFGILGQEGFFDSYIISFNRKKLEFELKGNEKKTPR
jgi:hypothetical protein